MSPFLIARRGGLSTRPSAHAVEVSTAESCVGYRSSPPCAFHFTRRNSCRASGCGHAKSARAPTARGRTSETPWVLRTNGLTKRRKVTKLETGLPGRPMKNACRIDPKASGRPGFMAIFHMKPGRPLAFGSIRQRSEEHTSELQSRLHLVCRLLLEKKKRTHFAYQARRDYQ